MGERVPILSRKAAQILRAGSAPGIPGNRNLAAKVAILEAAMPSIVQRAAREATRRGATQAQELMSAAFENEKYYGRAGRLRALERNTASYNRMKARMGFDRRRGHRSGNLQAAIDQSVSVSATGYGIRIDLPAAAAQTGALSYLNYYEEAKAPGLGYALPSNVKRTWEEYMVSRVRSLAASVLSSRGAGALIPKLLSRAQVKLWIGKVNVRLKVG